MKKFLLLITFLNVLYSNAQWNTVGSSTVDFKIKNAGIAVNGSFKTVQANVNFDENHLVTSSLIGVIQSNSISTGIALRDRHLKEKEEFFNVKLFPVLTMKSVVITKKSANTYTATWDLTIKGITKRVTSKLITKQDKEDLSVSSEFNINRNDWKVGGSSLFMSDTVLIKLKILLQK